MQLGELSNPDDVARVVRKSNNSIHNIKGLWAGIDCIYTTVKDAWKAEDKFEIVHDTTDFGHYIGEVESQEVTETDGDGESRIAVRQAMDKEMDRF